MQTQNTQPLKIPKIKPKVLSTVPNPEYVTALLIALPILIITKSETIYIKIPKPISVINFDSTYYCTQGLNFGTNIIVITKARSHFEKDNKLIIKPFAAD